jgi:quinol monooxygenase YgiN
MTSARLTSLGGIVTIMLVAATIASCQTPAPQADLWSREKAGMILITGIAVVAPENREKMLALGREQVTNSRAEEGNVSYGFYEDAMQPNTFIFVERWRDQAAVTTHFAQPYSGAFVTQVRAIALNTPAIEMHEISGLRTVIPGQ